MKNIIKAMADAGMIKSMAEGRRMIAMGAVKLNGEWVVDFEVDVDNDDLVELGKKRKFTVKDTENG